MAVCALSLKSSGPSGRSSDDLRAGYVSGAATIGDMSLSLQVDDVVTRQQLNAAYGGGIQGGMLTPAGGEHIFLFSDPVPGGEYGYTWDGWADDNLDTFFYTGEGSRGDQEFTRGNRILRDAATEEREVHLFVADGHTDGSRERTHRYMGQFTVDRQEPWRREESPDASGITRSAIVFRLNRLRSLPVPQTHIDSHSPALANRSGSELIDPEASNTGQFNRGPQEESVATRRERILENAFHQHLRAAGCEPARLKIRITGHAKPLYTDTWDASVRELYEAKGGVSRSDVRMAIGQLLDYRRHITPPPARCTVLLPSDPGNDLTDLIHSSGMDLVYQDGNTFTRRSASPGRSLGNETSVEIDEQLKTGTVAASFPSRPDAARQSEERQPAHSQAPGASSAIARNLTVRTVELD